MVWLEMPLGFQFSLMIKVRPSRLFLCSCIGLIMECNIFHPSSLYSQFLKHTSEFSSGKTHESGKDGQFGFCNTMVSQTLIGTQGRQ